jgi:hypothetical protein
MLIFALHSALGLTWKVAGAQAKEAQLRAARADLLPKLSLTGLAGYTRFDTTVRSAGPLEEMGFGLQNYGGFLTVRWPIFTGFGEENKVRLADTQRQAAVEELSLAKEKTIAEQTQSDWFFLYPACPSGNPLPCCASSLIAIIACSKRVAPIPACIAWWLSLPRGVSPVRRSSQR